jgi:excisionase family DNA binding protein
MSASSPTNGHAVPRLALTKSEAAEALGVSVDFFEDHVMCELRIVRRGRRRLIPLAELMRWLEDSADRALPDERQAPYSPSDRSRNESSSSAASRSVPGIKWP